MALSKLLRFFFTALNPRIFLFSKNRLSLKDFQQVELFGIEGILYISHIFNFITVE